MSDNLACARVRESATRWLSGFDPEDGHGPVGAEAGDPDGLFTQPMVIAAFAAGADQAEAEFAIERAVGQRQLEEAAALISETAALLHGYADHHVARAKDATDSAAELASLEKARTNFDMCRRLREWLVGMGDRLVCIADLNLGAVTALREGQHQVDADGTMVGVSRQALDEVLGWVDAVTAPAVEVELIDRSRTGDEITRQIDLNPVAALQDHVGWAGSSPHFISHDFGEDAATTAEVIDFPGVTTREQAHRMADRQIERLGNVRPVLDGPLADPAVVEQLMATPALRRPVLALSTVDPRFDPLEAVTVNGYRYQPHKEA